MTILREVAAFLAHATPEEVADLRALLPAIRNRRARLAGHHAAAQAELPTTREAAADGALASLLRGLGATGEK